MTRSELIAQLAKLNPQLLAKDIDLIVKTILDKIADTLAQGGRIEIRGFGSFMLNYRPPRQGRNPKIGTAVKIPAKYRPHFKAGKELRERVDDSDLILRKLTHEPKDAGIDSTFTMKKI